MDPQQELFSAVLMALKEKYKDMTRFYRRRTRRIHLFTWRIAPRVIRLQRMRLSARLI